MEHRNGRVLRVLAADDSAVMRGVLKTVFDLHARDHETTLPRMELVGVAKDGLEALEAARRLLPDVLLLDLEMPRMNGLGVLEQLRAEASRLPVIMCSAYTERGAKTTLDALSHGAKDYVMKPAQQADFASALDSLMQQLLPKIAELAGCGVVMAPTAVLSGDAPPANARTSVFPKGEQARAEVVVLGVSTGGPSALETLIPMLHGRFPVPVLIVQHMPKLFTGVLAERLNRLSELSVVQGKDGMAAVAGSVLIAPGDSHMELVRGAKGFQVKLHHGPALNSCKPSVDYLFRSAARCCGAGTLAVIMTGMGSDGLEGSREVREAGGTVLAQDEASSAVWGMPGRVVREGLASAVLPLAALAAAMMQHVGLTRRSSAASTFSAWPANKVGQEVAHGLL